MSFIDDFQDEAEWVGQNKDSLHLTPKTDWRKEYNSITQSFYTPKYSGSYGDVSHSTNSYCHTGKPVSHPIDSVYVDKSKPLYSEAELNRLNQLALLHRSLSFRINLAQSIEQTETQLLKMVVESYSDEMEELQLKIEADLQEHFFKPDKIKIDANDEKKKFIRQTISWLFSEINKTAHFKPEEVLAVFIDIRRLIAWDMNDGFVGGFASQPCSIDTALAFLQREYKVKEQICPDCGEKTICGCKACLRCGLVIGA